MMHALAKTNLPFLLITAFTLLAFSAARAEDAGSLTEAITEGNANIELRYRFEWVDEQGFDKDAKASTLRTRLNYTTASWRGFQAMVEFDDVRDIGFDDFNGGAGSTPNRGQFPLVADPNDTRVNQAWLALRPNDELVFKLGRQRIKLDEDRFIGNVGWRQNEQTYDGLRVDWEHDQWQAFYTYIDNVNRIFGNNVPAGNHEHSTHLAEGRYAFNAAHKLSAYLYQIDNEDVAVLSSRTLGIRYTGSLDTANKQALNWLVEYARQDDGADNPNNYSANYLHLRTQFELREKFAPKLGLEMLGGNDQTDSAFQTPLATLHAFNGWADRFLSTPDSGLIDVYAGFSGSHERYQWNVLAHQFSAETQTQTYGWELDASLSVRFNSNIALLLKAARFDSARPDFRDVNKFWTMLNMKF